MHNGPITSVVVSKDGKRVYTGGYDKCVYAWDKKSNTAELIGRHDHLVNFLAISNDGKLLASSSSDYTIRLYNLETLHSKVLLGHWDDVEAIAFSEDDQLLVSVSRDRRCLVWDVASGAVILDFRGHSRDVLSVWVNNGKVYSTGDDGRVLVWSISTGEILSEIGPFDYELDAVSGSDVLSKFAIGKDDGSVIVYDANSVEEIHELKAHEHGVKRLSFSPSGRYLLTAGYDHHIRLWSTLDWKLECELEPFKYQWERSLVWSADEEFILGASFGVSYCEWSVETGKLITREMELATPSIDDLSVSDTGDIVTASDDGRFRVNGLEEGWVDGTLTNAVGISPDGRFGLWGDHAGRVHLLDRRQKLKVTSVELRTGPINSVFFCREDNQFYIGTYGGFIHSFDPTTAQVKRSIKAHEGAIKAVRSNGRYVVSVCADSSIHVFTQENLQFEKSIKGPTAIVNDVALDSKSDRIVTVGRDKVVRLFDIRTGSIIAQHETHRYSIKSVEIMRDGLIASGDYWGYVTLWNYEDNEIVSTGRIASNGISALRTFDDVVLASSYDGGVYEVLATGKCREVLRLFDQDLVESAVS